MASNVFYIPKGQLKKLEKELLAVSGSFGIEGTQTDKNNVLIEINDKVPNYHLFKPIVEKYAERFASRTEALREKNERTKEIIDNDRPVNPSS